MVSREPMTFLCPECGEELEDRLGQGYDERCQPVTFDGVRGPGSGVRTSVTSMCITPSV